MHISTIKCGLNLTTLNWHFYRASARNATHGIAVGILSVCLSVHQMRVL